MLNKMIALLLTAFLTTPLPAETQPPSHHLQPGDCLPTSDCLCYLPSDVKKIANGIREREACRAELAMANKFIEESKRRHAPVLSWWQEPGVVGGGVVLGFGLGMLAVYAAQR